MKKYFLLFFALSALCACEPDVVYGQWMSTINITPGTSLERIDGEWKATIPATLNYGLAYSFTNGFYAGGGVGIGLDLNGNDQGNLNLNTPAMIFLGFQPSDKAPSFFLGGGENISSGNPIVAFGVHFTGLATSASNTKYKSLANNSDYKQTKIGFKPDVIK